MILRWLWCLPVIYVLFWVEIQSQQPHLPTATFPQQLLLFSPHAFVCYLVCRENVPATAACVWRSEDSLLKSVLAFHSVGHGD